MKLMTMLWNMGIKHLTNVKTKGKTEVSQYINPCVVKDAAIEASTSACLAIDFSWYTTCRALFNACAEMISCNKERLGIKSVKITAIILLRRNSLRMCPRGSLTLALLHDVLS